jgi:hypothetical protein
MGHSGNNGIGVQATGVNSNLGRKHSSMKLHIYEHIKTLEGNLYNKNNNKNNA